MASKLLTIQIVRPNFENLSDKEKQLLLEKLCSDIALQIEKQETIRLIDETINYWQRQMFLWEIEDQIVEAKYGNQHRSD